MSQSCESRQPVLETQEYSNRTSVVIPYGKLAGDIRRCVVSALSQTAPAAEVLVLINGAVNPEYAAHLLEDVLNDPKLKLIDARGCTNANQARNLGIRLATSEWIATLDSDDWWEIDHLEKSFDVVTAKRSHCELIYGSIRIWRSAASQVLMAEDYRCLGTPENYLLSYRPASACTYVFTRDLGIKQPWDESLRRHQDYEWFARVAKVCQIGVNANPTVNVEWSEERRHKFHADCWRVVSNWRELVDQEAFRRHHRRLVRSSLLSLDPFALRLLIEYIRMKRT